MVPASYTPYFTATATAAGVLIGLLFVAVSLRPETIFGVHAPVMGKVQAGSAFTALSDVLVVSLVALIPQAGVGMVSIIMSVLSIIATLQLHRELGRQEVQWIMLAYGLATYLFQFGLGLMVEFNQRDSGLVDAAAFLMIAQVAGALSRAWALVEGKHLRPAGDPELDAGPAAVPAAGPAVVPAAPPYTEPDGAVQDPDRAG